ncbi:hypothetical protein DPMN_113563 [Dreissena polymorpha]|uniref:Uncharacterized protein n=1 Tax=Dreissena polymorpha TaxID=45954 RepID=A0A9D4QQY0_DREPO|nr:hypothetical protein DPMN_113563 [Dreissena polymorpha]
MPDWGKYIGANRLAQVNNCGTVKPPHFNCNVSPRPKLSIQKQQRYVHNQCDTNPQTLSSPIHMLTEGICSHHHSTMKRCKCKVPRE